MFGLFSEPDYQDNGLLAGPRMFANALRDTYKQSLTGLLDAAATYLADTPNRVKRNVDKAFPDPRLLNPYNETPEAQAAREAVAGNVLGFAGMMVGPSSKTWKAADAAKAQSMEAAGVNARDIWKETGTWRGPDGAWRQEIADNNAIPGHKFYSWGESADLAQGNSTAVRRQKALLHPELSAAYPESKQIGVVVKPGYEGGHYNPDFQNITVGAEKNGAANRSTMLHELQHSIQQKEGWALGGSPEQFNPSAAEKARSILSYRNEIDNYIKKNWPKAKNDFETRWRADEQLRQEYYKMGAADMLPPRNVIEEALSPKLNSGSESRKGMESMVKEYGLDKRVSAFSPMEMYRRLAGEAEARMTQARMNLDANQRRALFPEDSYDVPINNLLIRR